MQNVSRYPMAEVSGVRSRTLKRENAEAVPRVQDKGPEGFMRNAIPQSREGKDWLAEGGPCGAGFQPVAARMAAPQ